MSEVHQRHAGWVFKTDALTAHLFRSQHFSLEGLSLRVEELPRRRKETDNVPNKGSSHSRVSRSCLASVVAQTYEVTVSSTRAAPQRTLEIRYLDGQLDSSCATSRQHDVRLLNARRVLTLRIRDNPAVSFFCRTVVNTSICWVGSFLGALRGNRKNGLDPSSVSPGVWPVRSAGRSSFSRPLPQYTWR